MKKSILMMLFGLFACLMTGCSSISIISDYDTSADFSKFNTYNFKRAEAPPDNYPVVMNELNQKRVEKYVDEQMSLRNYSKSDNPDLWITYYVRVEDKTRVESTTYGDPYHRSYYGPQYYGYYYGYNHTWTEVEEVNYKVGTLIVDLVDAKSNELVWYGAASKTLEENKPNPDKTIEEAIARMFYKYPFMAGKNTPVK